MTSAAGNSLRRRAYLWLTTSSRDRINRKDFMSQRAMALSHRNRIHKVNDAFHQAGQQGDLNSYASITLQHKDNAWGFLILPATFCCLLILFISTYGSGERSAMRDERRRIFEKRAAATAARAADAKRDLAVTRERLPGEMEELHVSDEERALADQLDDNLQTLSSKTAFLREPPSGDSGLDTAAE